MAWRIEFAAEAMQELARLDRQIQERIRSYLRQRIASSDNPRDFGQPLRRNLAGLWKYRVGDYRIVAEIQDQTILVLVLRIGHRSKIYGGH